MSCSNTATLAPPAGLAAHLWIPDSTESSPTFNCEVFGVSETAKLGDATQKASLAVPKPIRPALSHKYPNLSQQLEDFLWSRSNSYAGTLSDSIYEGETIPVVNTVTLSHDTSARAIKNRLLGAKKHVESVSKVVNKNCSDRDTWSQSSILEDGRSDKGPLLLRGGAPDRFVVVQTTEIKVEFE